MAPLPQNNTSRLFLDYQVGPDQHTLSLRYAEGVVTPATVMTRLDSILDVIGPAMYLMNVVAVRKQVQGSNVSTPLAWTGNASYGSGAIDNWKRTLETRWIGRSADGRKTSFSLYGVNWNPTLGYRVYTSGNAAIATIDGILATMALAGEFITISGNPAEPYPYVDLNYNSYWEHEVRV